MSDVLPTLASAAGVSAGALAELGLDGVDFGAALRNRSSIPPRSQALLEMYYGTSGEFMFPEEDVVAFRKGRFKLIESTRLRDAHWCRLIVMED